MFPKFLWLHSNAAVNWWQQGQPVHFCTWTHAKEDAWCVTKMVINGELGKSSAMMWWATSAQLLKAEKCENLIASTAVIWVLSTWFFLSVKLFQRWFHSEEWQNTMPRGFTGNVLKPAEGKLSWSVAWYSSWKSLICFMFWCVYIFVSVLRKALHDHCSFLLSLAYVS